MKMSDTKLPEAIDMQLIEGGPLKPEDHPVQIWLDEEWTVWNHSGENDQGEENVSYIRADLALACVEALRKKLSADDKAFMHGGVVSIAQKMSNKGAREALAAFDKSFPQRPAQGATDTAESSD
jgi:hypothetical protein